MFHVVLKVHTYEKQISDLKRRIPSSTSQKSCGLGWVEAVTIGFYFKWIPMVFKGKWAQRSHASKEELVDGFFKAISNLEI